MNKNLLIRNGIVFFSLAISNQLYSQVGINTNKPAATLDVVSHPTANVLDGIIAPRISASDLKNKIYSSEQTGAFLYVTEGFGSIAPSTQTALIKNSGYYVFDGSQWKPFVSDIAWSTSGNGGTTSSNFIGTTDNSSLNFKVNNIHAGWIENDEYGNVSFGRNSIPNSANRLASTAMGTRALSSLTRGIFNSALGTDALPNVTTGQGNTAMGSNSGYRITTGISNSFFGHGAGATIDNGNYNVHIGSGSTAGQVKSINNTINIGYSSSISENNTIVIGNRSQSRGINNIILGHFSELLGTNQATNRINCVSIGNYVGVDRTGPINNKFISDNELIINNYTSSLDDDIPLIRGNFTVGSKYFKIGGKLILEPTLTPNATSDLAYPLKVVAKTDGTIGFSTDTQPVITVNSTSVSRVRITNDLSSSVTARTAVPNWNFNVTNGKVYKIKIFGAYSTIATTTGGSLGFILTNGATGTIFGKVQMNIVHTNTAAPEQVITAIDNSSTTVRSFATSTGVGTINIPEVIDGEVIFECTADGTFNLQWGSEVASSTATLLKNSIIEIIEI